MAYVSGTAASMAALASSIAAACVANGWSVAGNVIYKGNLYVEITSAAAYVNFLAGTSQAAGVISGSPAPVRLLSHSDGTVWTFPVNYEVHILTNPDEVYVVVNHNSTKFQYAAWGQSTIPDVGGTGMWISATCGNVTAGGAGFQTFGGSYSFGATNAFEFALFGQASASASRANSHIHTSLEGTTGWRAYPHAFLPIAPLLGIQPNTWNGETLLVPMPARLPWASGAKVSIVAQPAHVRACRITNHQAYDTITIASDKWRIYPWREKNTASPDGAVNQDHSGTWGFAVRYTGP